jgi:hypothetical protein
MCKIYLKKAFYNGTLKNAVETLCFSYQDFIETALATEFETTISSYYEECGLEGEKGTYKKSLKEYKQFKNNSDYIEVTLDKKTYRAYKNYAVKLDYGFNELVNWALREYVENVNMMLLSLNNKNYFEDFSDEVKRNYFNRLSFEEGKFYRQGDLDEITYLYKGGVMLRLLPYTFMNLSVHSYRFNLYGSSKCILLVRLLHKKIYLGVKEWLFTGSFRAKGLKRRITQV